MAFSQVSGRGKWTAVLPFTEMGNAGREGFLLLRVWFSRVAADNEIGLGSAELEVECLREVQLGLQGGFRAGDVHLGDVTRKKVVGSTGGRALRGACVE